MERKGREEKKEGKEERKGMERMEGRASHPQKHLKVGGNGLYKLVVE